MAPACRRRGWLGPASEREGLLRVGAETTPQVEHRFGISKWPIGFTAAPGTFVPAAPPCHTRIATERATGEASGAGTLRVSNLKDVLSPYRRAEDLSRYEEGLRQAGLPE
jgi:hypothetical protein